MHGYRTYALLMNIRLEFNYDKTWVRILTCPNTLTVWLFPWSTGITLLKTDSHLYDQEIPIGQGTRRRIVVFTTGRHCSLSIDT